MVQHIHMLYALVLAAAAAAAGPDPQSIFDQAALAWEARSEPDEVSWSLEVLAPGSVHAATLSCTATPGSAKQNSCAAPDGSALFFDENDDPFREPPESYVLSLADGGTLDGVPVYHVTVSSRNPADRTDRLHDLWVGTDDFEVRRLTYGSTTYDFTRFGNERIWWTDRAGGAWGSAVTQSVSFSGPKTIVRLRVTPLCSAVRTMVLPFLQIERGDRALFANMDANVQHYSEAAQVAADPGSPGLILARANLDWYSAQLYVNLARADLLLKASYERTPQGTDAPLDAIRMRIQTLVDVERIATNDYASLAAPRETSYRYWNSVAQEVTRIKELDGGGAHSDPPPAEDYGTGWLFTQLLGERREIVRPAMMAADYCGLQLP